MEEKGFAQIFLLFVLIIICISILKFFAFRRNSLELNPAYKPSEMDNNSYGLQISPTLAPLTNSDSWTVYTNKYINYSIKYPAKDWEISLNNEVAGILSQTYIVPSKNNNIKGIIEITLQNLADIRKSFKYNSDYCESYYLGSSYYWGNVKEQQISDEVIKLSGKNGIKYSINFTDKDNVKGKAVYIFLPYSDKYLLFISSFSYDDATDNLFTKIISTFKFTK